MKTLKFLLAIVFLSSCGLSTEEVAKSAKDALQENNENLVIDSVKLVHKEGNVYNGLMYYHNKNMESILTQRIEVLYDGENISARAIN